MYWLQNIILRTDLGSVLHLASLSELSCSLHKRLRFREGARERESERARERERLGSSVIVISVSESETSELGRRAAVF